MVGTNIVERKNYSSGIGGDRGRRRHTIWL